MEHQTTKVCMELWKALRLRHTICYDGFKAQFTLCEHRLCGFGFKVRKAGVGFEIYPREMIYICTGIAFSIRSFISLLLCFCGSYIV